MPESLAERVNGLRQPVLEAAEAHEQFLVGAYERELRRAGRLIAQRFRDITTITVVQAAADWTPPSVADIMAIQVSTARIRKGQAAMMGAITDTLNEAGLTTPGGVSVGFDIAQPFPERMLAQLGERAAMLDEAIRETVAASVARGWAEGASVPRTAGYIYDSVWGVTPAQATMLARTDLIGMSNGANQWAVQTLNDASAKNQEPKPFATKTWLSAGDARVRDTHQDADGQTVAMDQPYQVGGSPISYPGDPFGPNAEVCNCRCTETYNERVRAPEAATPEPEPVLVEAGPRTSFSQVFPKLPSSRAGTFASKVNDALQVIDDAFTGLTDEAIAKLDPIGGQLKITPNQSARAHGAYYSLGRSPMKMEISRKGPHPATTVLHEVGHYVEHQAIGEAGTWTIRDRATDAAKAFMEAAENSAAIKEIRSMRAAPRFTTRDGRDVPKAKSANAYLDYLVQPEEIWARAFTQYMVERFGTTAIRREFDEMFEQGRTGQSVVVRTEWDMEDFGEVGEAVEKVLREAGLLTDEGLSASFSALLETIDPRLLATVERRDPLDGLFAGQVGVLHQEDEDLVLRPSVVSEGLGVNHAGSHPTSVVTLQAEPDEEAKMSTTFSNRSGRAVDVGTGSNGDFAVLEEAAAVGEAWVSDVAYEGLSTGDGRFMVPGSLRWRTPPLTLMAMIETTEGGHLGAQVAGRMDTFDKADTSILTGAKMPAGVTAVHSTGVFDIGEYASDIERMVDTEVLTGISVDLQIHEWGLRDTDTGEIVAPEDASEEQWERAFMGEMEFAVIDAEIMAATVCPTPAFADAKIALLASGDARQHPGKFWRANAFAAEALGVEVGAVMTTLWAKAAPAATLTAAADAPVVPLNPKRSAFFRPEADTLTPLTIDGYHVYGHLAPYDACHVGLINGAWSQCVTPPKSASGYQQFHASGHVETEEGDVLPIGKLMISPEGHAPASGTPAAARRFYDKTGAAGAYVRCIDGKLGIWFSGTLRPGITPAEIATLRANAQSGDWRGNSPYDLELIAAVSVSIPGYGVPSQVALAASADGDVYVSAMILTCRIGEPVGQSFAGRAAAALMDGGTDALHALIAE